MAQIPFPLFCIKIRTAPSWLETCSFMKGMPQKKVRLRASWPPDHGVGSDKDVGKSYLHMVLFLHFGWPRLWKMARRNGCRGVQFSPSNNQVCKKRSPNKVDYFIFNSIFSSETQVTVPKNTFLWKVPRWLCGQITWKIPLNELNEFIL